MRRKLFTVAAAVSAVLWTVSLWLFRDGAQLHRLSFARTVWIDFIDDTVVIERANGSGLLPVVGVSYRVLMLWMMVLPFCWLVRWIGDHNVVIFGKREPEQGKCASCGYDLRATPDRCPECGAVPTLK